MILPPPGDIRRPPGPRRQVIELPNRSHLPRDSYEMLGDDIILEIDEWSQQLDVGQEEVDAIVIWHTHPGGGVGPSKRDMEAKTTRYSHIVLSLLPSEGYVHTLF